MSRPGLYCQDYRKSAQEVLAGGITICRSLTKAGYVLCLLAGQQEPNKVQPGPWIRLAAEYT
jgi:hypothetical protein